MTVLKPPSGLKTVDVTAHDFTLNWNAVTDADSYTIKYRINKKNPDDFEVYDDGITDPTYDVTELLAKTQYVFQVFTVNDDDESLHGTSINVTTKGVTMVMPDTLAVAIRGDTYIKLTWVASEGPDPSTYHVQYREKGDKGWTSFVHDDSTVENIIVTGLDPITKYQFRVAAADGGSVSAFTEPVSANTLDPTMLLVTGQLTTITTNIYSLTGQVGSAVTETGSIRRRIFLITGELTALSAGLAVIT